MRVLLFTGKGGVGKTTLAAATAARMARDGRKILVVSTDPAHSLGDALHVRLGAEPFEVDAGRLSAPSDAEGSAIDGSTVDDSSFGESTVDGGAEPLVRNLFACQIDPRLLVDGAWRELREHLHTVLAGSGVDELAAEELTVLPGVEELLALGEVARLARGGPWETVVVDCGPTAETLRLLALPDAVAGYLERLFPTHRRVVRGLLGGLAGTATIDRWDAAADALGRLVEELASLRALLTDADTTSVRLVCTPERVVAAETRRTLTALALQGIHVDGVLANRVFPAAGAGRGAAATWLRARRAEQDAVLAELHDTVAVGVRPVGHRSREPIGLAELLALADAVYGDEDPLAGAPPGQRIAVDGGGTGLDARYRLHLSMPINDDTCLDLVRVREELVITVDGQRRIVALPSVLRRCLVDGAAADPDGLTVRFRPDPALWIR